MMQPPKGCKAPLSMKINWTKPFRRYGGNDYRALSSISHLSCWDCEHIRVGTMFSRMCIKHRRKHIYTVGSIESEVIEENECGRKGSVADRCRDFQVASEFTFLLPIREKVLTGV